MSKTSHLYRRGNVLYFRLSVPDRFRAILKVSEFTQSLHTQNRKDAIPAAYRLAGEAKTLFNYIDSIMSDKELNGDFYEIDDDLLRAVVEELDKEAAKEKEAAKKKGSGHSLKSLMALKKKDIEINTLKERHEKELEQVELKTKAAFVDKIPSVSASGQNYAPPAQPEPIKAKSINKKSKIPLLSEVRKSLVENLDKTSPAANKKTKAVKWWNIFIELIGDKPIDELGQIDIDCFLEEVCRLPSNDTAPEYKGLSFEEKIKLCRKNKSETIAKKTFVNSYKSPVKKFVEHGYKEFKSFGFEKLTVNDSNKYDGNQAPGKNEQRNLTIVEVDKLINNDLMRSYIDNPEKVHFYWFVMLGLFSGARLNEICQLHPARDIRKDEKKSVWFFEVTEDDEDIDGIKEGGVNQLAKTDTAKREVPIHQKLVDLGFIDYVLKRRAESALMIFPFVPRKDGDIIRAGSNAGVFMTTYLKKIGLYDPTPHNKVCGLHCLRKTFITEASDCYGKVHFKHEDDEIERLMLSFGKIAPIVGHETGVRNKAGENVSMTAFYAKRRLKELQRGDISKKKAVVDLLDYGIEFPYA